MKILINYNSDESNFLPVLKYYVTKQNLMALTTNLNLSLGDLVNKAQICQCDAIYLVNHKTLANCVPESNPSLDDYRGSVLRSSIPIVVGNSLAHSHTINHGSWLMDKDLSKLHTCKEKHEKFKFTVLETTGDMQLAYKNICEKAALLAYDIETISVGANKEELKAPDTVISCVSWTMVTHNKEFKTYVLPLIDFGIDHWKTDEQYIEAIEFLRKINATSIPKAMHNGSYDALHSMVYRAPVRNWTIDTMGLAHAQYSELPKTLDFVASLWFPDYIQWKGEAKAASSQKDIHRYWQYNGLDSWYTARLAIHYVYNTPAYARTNYNMLFPLVYPCLYCAFEGMLIDNKERVRLLKDYELGMEHFLARIRTLVANPYFNPSSPKQVAEYIYDVFGASDPRIGKKKKGNKKVQITRGTDSKNMKAVGTQHPILLRLTEEILDYKTHRKAIGTYFTFLQKNGRLLYSLNPFGTDTGRMSCQSSSFWCGTQMQNIPGYAKAMMIADEGFILIEGDKSQSEARCTAYLARDKKLIEALEGELDFYTSLGDKFFNIPYAEVTPDFRQLLKKICHGTNYVMGAQTFLDNAGATMLLKAAERMGISISMAAHPAKGQLTLKQFSANLLEAYHKPFNRIRAWYGEVKHEIASTRMLRSPLGYTRYFFGDIQKNHNILRSAIAHGPQNLSVAILNKGFMNAWELVKQYPKDVRLKAQIHDSSLAQIREGREDLIEKYKNALDTNVMVHGKPLVIPNEFKISKVWKEAK